MSAINPTPPPSGAVFSSDDAEGDLRGSLFDAIESRSVPEVERFIDRIKAASDTKALEFSRDRDSAGQFLTPLTLLFRDRIGAEFEIADLLLNAHRELGVTLLELSFFSHMVKWEAEAIESPDERFVRFVEQVVEEQFSIDSVNFPHEVQKRLNSYLIASIKLELPQFVKALIKQGANVDHIVNGKSPLDIARERSGASTSLPPPHLNIVNILEEARRQREE